MGWVLLRLLIQQEDPNGVKVQIEEEVEDGRKYDEKHPAPQGAPSPSLLQSSYSY